MWSNSDWVRLVLLLVLSLGATGLVNWLAGILIVAIIATVLHWLVGWSWAWGLQVSLAAAFVLPLFIKILWKNFRIALLFAVFVGIPAILISKYLFAVNWPYAFFDGIVMMQLLPLAVIRVLTILGIIDLPIAPKEPSWSANSSPPTYPFNSNAPSTSSSSPISIKRNPW